MTTIYDQTVKLLKAKGEITYLEAARELNCDMSSVGKAFRQLEKSGQVTIDKSVLPFVVKSRGQPAS